MSCSSIAAAIGTIPISWRRPWKLPSPRQTSSIPATITSTGRATSVRCAAAFAKHGLATEEADCQDTVTVDAAKTEPAVALAVLSSDAQGAKLMAAGPEATRELFACVGVEAACLAAPKKDVIFKLDGTKGAKVLFVTEQPFALAEQQSLTLFAVDGQGATLGKRTFLVHSK